ncbi:MAG: carboxypeptidase, partial [Inquilinus sp.]|nr:carboxypeptidase [Inquilinus sp.]
MVSFPSLPFRKGSRSRRGRRSAGASLWSVRPARRRTATRGRGHRGGRVARGGWHGLVVRWTAAAFGAGFVVLLATTAWLVFTLPHIDEATIAERRPSITLIAADGAVVHRFGDLVGDPLKLDQMPAHLVQAVLATEDRRFYWHLGIDPMGIARAMWVNLKAGRFVQGGSTITQQLAKNLFLTPERTLRRKAQEALLAVWLELRFSKDEILAAYLNRVYMGAGTYGVEAAARTYFGVPVTDVGLEQAAMLAGLLKAPSTYAPTRAPELAAQRALIVLNAMVEEEYLTEADIERLRGLPPLPRRRPSSSDGGRYFADWVADQLQDYAGYDHGDLTVKTTLD